MFRKSNIKRRIYGKLHAPTVAKLKENVKFEEI